MLMLLAGTNPKVASERPSHASVVIVLATYSHVLPSMRADATEKFVGFCVGRVVIDPEKRSLCGNKTGFSAFHSTMVEAMNRRELLVFFLGR
jgi:hypothetical protein